MTIGFSTCPNDTFIFDALVNGKLYTDLQFEVRMGDVQELNELAIKGELDITKLSYKAYAYVSDKYQLLTSGSALGRGCGPLLIARNDNNISIKNLSELKLAIPGRHTTADLLLSHAVPNVNNRVEMLFSEIENAVLDGEVDAGLIIHENRFTYQNKGLIKLIDLGENWEKTTGFMIPLGGIAVKRSLNQKTKLEIDRLIRASVEFAWKNPQDVMGYVGQHAQEMDARVMQQHINLYVNEYTASLGEEGRKAVEHLYQSANLPELTQPIFVSN